MHVLFQHCCIYTYLYSIQYQINRKHIFLSQGNFEPVPKIEEILGNFKELVFIQNMFFVHNIKIILQLNKMRAIRNKRIYDNSQIREEFLLHQLLLTLL